MITILLLFIIFFITIACPMVVFVVAMAARRRDAREAKEKAEQEKQKQEQASATVTETSNETKLSDDEMRLIQELRKKKNEERIANAFSRDEEEKKRFRRKRRFSFCLFSKGGWCVFPGEISLDFPRFPFLPLPSGTKQAQKQRTWREKSFLW